MGRNLEKDAIEMAAKNQRILENGFRIFSEHGIETVTMNEVAKAAGIAISSLYRYYSTKTKLVMGISIWAWEAFMEERVAKKARAERPDWTAADLFDFYLESFLDLYRSHKDLLRFNQFFNIYLMSEGISREEKKAFTNMVLFMETQFERIYRKGQQDGTLRTDVPKKRMFSATLHLMLAVVTRYAVGLAYTEETEPEEELQLQKEMLVRQYTVPAGKHAS